MANRDGTTVPREEGEAARHKPLRQRLVSGRVLVSLLIAAGFVWLLLRGGFPLVPPSRELARVPWWALGTYLTLVAASALVRGLRWAYLIRAIAPQVPMLRSAGVCMVGFSAVFFAPLRSGEIVRPYLISQGGQVSFMQAAGSVGAERIIDGLVVTLFTFVALSTATMVSPLPTSLGDLPLSVAAVSTAVYSALLVFSAAFVVMTVFYVARERATRLTHRIVGLISTRAADFAADTLSRIADGLSFLPSRGNLLRFLHQTVLYWALAIGAQWVLLRGIGLDASVAQATTTVGVQGLGLLVPAGPGMFGAYQIVSYSSLAMFFPMAEVKTTGALFIFVTYTSQLLLNGLQLVAGFWFISRARLAPGPDSKH